MEALAVETGKIFQSKTIEDLGFKSAVAEEIKNKGFVFIDGELHLEVYGTADNLKAIVREPCSCCGKPTDILELEDFGGMCFRCEDMRYDAMMEAMEEDRIEAEDWEEFEDEDEDEMRD